MIRTATLPAMGLPPSDETRSLEVDHLMPLGSVFSRTMATTRQMPPLVRVGVTVGLTLATFGVRMLAAPILPPGYPFLLAFLAVLLSSSLFNSAAGFVSAAVSALVGAYLYLPPQMSLHVESAANLVGLAVFLGVSTITALIIETLHTSLAGLRATEAKRRLLLHEFQHRSRNDLQSLVALLLLRARAAGTDEAREGLREAADHARGLARIHTRLAGVGAGADNEPVISTRDFILGLVQDLRGSAAGNGLRPIAFAAHAEAHPLASEQAVQLGLVLNEVVTNALKYGFPDERAGMIQVMFHRDGPDYVLEVRDDGVGLPPESSGRGLGTRLLRGLAAQLRGKFSREPAPGGGTQCLLRFPAGPVMPPLAPP